LTALLELRRGLPFTIVAVVEAEVPDRASVVVLDATVIIEVLEVVPAANTLVVVSDVVLVLDEADATFTTGLFMLVTARGQLTDPELSSALEQIVVLISLAALALKLPLTS